MPLMLLGLNMLSNMCSGWQKSSSIPLHSTLCQLFRSSFLYLNIHLLIVSRGNVFWFTKRASSRPLLRRSADRANREFFWSAGLVFERCACIFTLEVCAHNKSTFLILPLY